MPMDTAVARQLTLLTLGVMVSVGNGGHSNSISVLEHSASAEGCVVGSPFDCVTLFALSPPPPVAFCSVFAFPFRLFHKTFIGELAALRKVGR
jgi:hypothetical protein